ncbi:hypothetical protein IPP75_05165 [Candidatus Saccharibacteria bacterium]|nr:MAG: hypothetical protein IPP75_05165 [Candidatus Saccharibacteria bacterium]
MQAYTPPDTKATRAEYGWRYIFTRMVPTAIIVFFILFTFFPDFGSPVSNLRRLGEGSGRLSSEQQKQSALTVATGLQQLQASGQLGSYLQLSGGGVNGQTLSWDEQLHLLTISNGNTVDLGSLVAAGGQTLTKSGNTLGLEGSTTTVDLASYLDNTDAQTLSLNGATLTVSGGNSINLAPINTDSQNLSLSGTTLNISGGAGVDIASINTDVLAGLSCSVGQVVQWDGSAWGCASPAASSDAQTLNLAGNNLNILNGNSVSLAGYLDNTDSQALSLGGNTLSLVNGGSVNLAAYLDNTDVLASLACGVNQVAKWNGSNWACAADNDTTTNESQVDAWVANNGYLTSEVDGSTSNELQSLSWNGGTHILTISSGNTADLGSLLDNTDAQAISRTGNTISITGSASTIDLSPYLDNTDAQAISRTGNTLSITGNASTVDLASYLDNTDAQTLSLAGTTLTVSGGNSIDLAPINTDAQTLSLAGTNLSVSGGNTINIASINTDVLAGLSCATNQIAKWNGSAWACAADVDTVLNEAQVDAYANNNGYLTSEVDGSITNEIQSLSLVADVLSVSGGNSVNLASYLDNTDAQTLSWNSGAAILTIAGGNTANLSSLLDNTDAQAISKTGNTLSITGNASTVDLSGYLDNTDTLASLSCSNGQVAQWNGSAWVCANAAVDTDQQTLSLASNNLSISGGNSVSLASYLDNTDAQAISKAGNVLSISGNASTVDLSGYLDNTDSQALSLGGNTLSLVNGGSVNLAAYLDNTDVLAGLSCSNNQIPKWNGSAWTCAADVDTVLNEAQVDAYANNNGYLTSEVDGSTSNELQTLTWNSGTHILTISSGNTADLGSLLDNTDAQAISKTGNTLSITGNASTVDLASYLDNTDSQTLGLAGTTLTVSGGNSIDLAPINTDSQNLSLTGTTLNISGGTGVDIASINTDVLAGLSCSTNQIAKWNGSAWTCAADVDTNTDAQTLSLASNNLSILNGNSVSLAGYLDNTDSQTLSYNTGTHVLSISGGNTQDLSNLLDNTDAQAISRTGNTVSITGNASTVDLTPYLDNTDVLASLSCSNTQIAKWNGSAWACAADVDTVLTEGQVDTYVSNNGYLTSEVDGSTSNELQDLNLSSNILTITSLGSPTNIDLAGYLDNTDALAALSCVDGKIVKRVAGVWACGDDTDTVLSEAQVDTYVSNNGYLTSEVDGSTTNELQNVFQAVVTPDANNPAADSTTDSLTLANGSGVNITSNGTTDTITIAATLGTSISNAEIDDATLTFSKLAANSCNNGEIVKFNGSAWVCGTDSDTTLSEAAVEAYIFDADNTGTLSSGTLALGSLSYTGTLGDANIADALTISSAGSVDDAALSSNVTKLGQTIESGEITNGTITGTDLASATIQFSNIAQNGCSSNQIMKWNGSAWACAADATGGSINSFETFAASSGTSPVADSATDTLTLSGGSGVTITGDGTTDTITVAATLGTSIDSAEIVDGTIVSADIADGTIANTDLANSSVTVSAGTGLTGGGAVSLGGTITLNLANDFGASIDSSEITNGTIVFADVAANGCLNGEIFKYNGSAWMCGSDLGLTSEVDGSTTNELQNLFLTIATPDAGNPAADSTTDTLTFANGSGVSITSNGTTDTITVAATLGTDITSSEIADGTIAAIDLGSDSVTGIKILDGAVALAKLATDSVNGTKIVDGTVANADLAFSNVTVSAGTGLTGGGAINLGGTVTLNSSIGTSVETGEITDGTIAAADISPDVLDFTEFKDSMALDATTTIALGANAFNINLDSTGDFVVQDAGIAVLTVNDSGTLLFKNSADNANAFVVQDAANLPMFTVDTISNTVEVGTLVDDAADVLLVLDGVSGSDPTGIAGSIYYNITNNKFRCYQGTAWVDCVPAAYNEYAFAAGLETWTNMPAAETQFLNTPIRLQVDLTRASEFRFGISRMAGAVTAGADCRVQYATTQTGTYANLDGATGPEVDVSGTAELKSSAWTAVTGAAKSDVYLRIMCKQGNGVDDPQFRNAYIQVR